MSSGFLLAEALSEALRKPYQKGDMSITVRYLVEGLKLGGEYRVMLKKNFDTACWIPPIGKRGSHSIYYGDRMVAHILERFVRVQSLDMPTKGVFGDQVKAAIALESEALKKAALAKAEATKTKAKRMPPPPKVNPMCAKTRVLDLEFRWVRDNTSAAQWDLLMDLLLKAVVSYGRHERQHARHTPRDMKQVNRDLRLRGIPFRMFNLFEDARIEHLSRLELGEPFDWLEFEDLGSPNHPAGLFFRCIQLEGAPDQEALDSEDPFKEEGGRTLRQVAESVQAYYRRACACTTAEMLYPIIVEFLAEFKDDMATGEPGKGEPGKGEPGKGKPGEGSEGASEADADISDQEPTDKDQDEDDETGNPEADDQAGDLSTAAEAAEEGDSFFDTFEADTEIVGGTDEEGKAAEEKAKAKARGKSPVDDPKNQMTGGMGIPGSVKPEESGGQAKEEDFLALYPGKIDKAYQKRVDNLTAMLMRMFKTHSLPAATESPGQRMSSRHLAHGELRWVHRKVYGGKGKRKYSIVYDCSGSMTGQPDREGKLFLLALNNLAKRGFLEGSLILTGWVSGRPGWLSYKFPVKDEIILRIRTTHSAEGIQAALKDNLKKIKNNDEVFVYTDACICDKPLDKVFFAKQRVWPVGLYVGPENVASEMGIHFPQNIIKDRIEDLVETMLIRNRRTVG